MVDRLGLGAWRGPVLAIGVTLVAVVGLGQALALQRAGQRESAIVAVGLVGVLVSPIAWIHEAVWTLPALARLVATARRSPSLDARRLWWGVAAIALMLSARLPALGARLAEAHVALPFAQVLEDTVGLVALGLLVWHRPHKSARIDGSPSPNAGSSTPQSSAQAAPLAWALPSPFFSRPNKFLGSLRRSWEPGGEFLNVPMSAWQAS